VSAATGVRRLVWIADDSRSNRLEERWRHVASNAAFLPMDYATTLRTSGSISEFICTSPTHVT
jgi:hypothetical protein